MQTVESMSFNHKIVDGCIGELEKEEIAKYRQLVCIVYLVKSLYLLRVSIQPRIFTSSPEVNRAMDENRTNHEKLGYRMHKSASEDSAVCT